MHYLPLQLDTNELDCAQEATHRAALLVREGADWALMAKVARATHRPCPQPPPLPPLPQRRSPSRNECHQAFKPLGGPVLVAPPMVRLEPSAMARGSHTHERYLRPRVHPIARINQFMLRGGR